MLQRFWLELRSEQHSLKQVLVAALVQVAAPVLVLVRVLVLVQVQVLVRAEGLGLA